MLLAYSLPALCGEYTDRDGQREQASLGLGSGAAMGTEKTEVGGRWKGEEKVRAGTEKWTEKEGWKNGQKWRHRA